MTPKASFERRGRGGSFNLPLESIRRLNEPPRLRPAKVASRHFYQWAQPPLLSQQGNSDEAEDIDAIAMDPGFGKMSKLQTPPVHMSDLQIRNASERDIPVILWFIRQLAEYERLSGETVVTEELLRESLFGERPVAEVILGYHNDEPVGFAVFFHNFSTFLGKPGLYLEDLFVIPGMRGKGFGRAMLVYLANLACGRNCGRFEWSVLDWNESAINFYKNLGAVPMSEWTVFRVSGEALKKLAGES